MDSLELPPFSPPPVALIALIALMIAGTLIALMIIRIMTRVMISKRTQQASVLNGTMHGPSLITLITPSAISAMRKILK